MQTELNNMILIGGSHRQSGKTDIACHIIEKTIKSGPIVCLKVCCHDANDARDTKADLMLDDFWLVKEEPQEGTKSTDRMYASGAQVVYRLIVMRETLEEGLQLFLETIGENKIIICESNSLRDLVKPFLFIFVDKITAEKEKNSSSRVRQYADVIIENNKGTFNPAIEKIKVPNLKKNLKKVEK
jgi:hypothetical protein